MDTTHPATWSAHAFEHLVAHGHNVLLPRLRLGDGRRPADPLITGQRRDIFPYFPNLFVSKNCLAHIGRQFVYGTRRKCLSCHTTILAHLTAQVSKDAHSQFGPYIYERQRQYADGNELPAGTVHLGNDLIQD